MALRDLVTLLHSKYVWGSISKRQVAKPKEPSVQALRSRAKMSSKKAGPQGPVIVFDPKSDLPVSVPAIELDKQMAAQYSAMARSTNEEMRDAGIQGLEQMALGDTVSVKALMMLRQHQNRRASKGPRAKHANTADIQATFKRLIAEQHTEREARSILKGQGLASVSTIYRITTAPKKKIVL